MRKKLTATAALAATWRGAGSLGRDALAAARQCTTTWREGVVVVAEEKEGEGDWALLTSEEEEESLVTTDCERRPWQMGSELQAMVRVCLRAGCGGSQREEEEEDYCRPRETSAFLPSSPPLLVFSALPRRSRPPQCFRLHCLRPVQKSTFGGLMKVFTSIRNHG